MSTTASFDEHLRALLDELDAIRRCDPGVTEPRIREMVTMALGARLVRCKEAEIPKCFGLLDDEGQPCGDINSRLRAALQRFVAATLASMEWRRCSTEEERRALIADEAVRSAAGSSLSSYVGSF